MMSIGMLVMPLCVPIHDSVLPVCDMLIHPPQTHTETHKTTTPQTHKTTNTHTNTTEHTNTHTHTHTNQSTHKPTDPHAHKPPTLQTPTLTNTPHQHTNMQTYEHTRTKTRKITCTILKNILAEGPTTDWLVHSGVLVVGFG